MARVIVNRAKVEVPPVESYTLELTPGEADVLKTVLGQVAGDPELSRRKDSDAVYQALKGAGVHGFWGDLSGFLSFRSRRRE